MPDPVTPQQSHLALARMAVSRAMADVEADSTNYQRKGFLTLTGLYEAMAQPLAENSLSLSTALIFDPQAAIFVVRTTVSSIQTGESDHSDFPVASITKKDDIGGLMTFGTRYNVMGLFSFFPSRDPEEQGQSSSGGQSWSAPAAAAQPWSAPAPAAPPAWAPAPASPPAWSPPAATATDYDLTRAYSPAEIQAAAQGAPPAWNTPPMPPQTGTQRTEPLYQPTQDPSVAPQVLS